MASVRGAPRAIAKVPATGQRSLRTLRASGMTAVRRGSAAPRDRPRLFEPPGRVRQHGVDLAGLRGEIGARHHRAAVVARHVVEQPLELGDVAVDRLLELAVGAVALADLLERALPLHGVEALGEHVAFAALVAVPQLGGDVVVDHAGDVDRERIERLDRVARRTLFLARARTLVVTRAAWTIVARRSRKHVGEPAAAAIAARGRG